jgi:hypothetical protein
MVLMILAVVAIVLVTVGGGRSSVAQVAACVAAIRELHSRTSPVS